MFDFFKKRQSVPTAEELSALAASALEDVKNKWVYFNQTLQLKAEVLLSEKIDFFAQPIQHFFQTKYPLLLKGSSEIFCSRFSLQFLSPARIRRRKSIRQLLY